MDSALVSVIVPVYKVEPYLDRCVQSIVDQTYQNLEIILVDDGSPDNCPAMCDAWAEKEPRIIVIHKTNGGVSSARNVGIDIAKGIAVCFVDSDDTIHPRFIEILFTILKTSKTDVVICGTENKSTIDCIEKNNTEESYTISANTFFNIGMLRRVVWGKIYNRETIKEIRFPIEYQVGEDTIFNYMILIKNPNIRICMCPCNMYNYYPHGESLSAGESGFYGYLNVGEWCLNVFRANDNPSIQSSLLMEALKELFLFRLEMNESSNGFHKCTNLIKQNARYILYTPGISLINRLAFYAMAKIPCLYKFMTIIQKWKRKH